MVEKAYPDESGKWKVDPKEKTEVGANAGVRTKQFEEAQAKGFFERVGEGADYLNKLLGAYAKERGLAPDEIVAMVYLENINNREYYPDGTKAFDQICKGMWDWFQANKE